MIFDYSTERWLANRNAHDWKKVFFNTPKQVIPTI